MKAERILTLGHGWQWWLLYVGISVSGWFIANAIFGWKQHGWFWVGWGIVLATAMTVATRMENKYWKKAPK